MTNTSLTVRAASAMTGRSKQAILKAIHAGRLSAQRGDNQEWLIEPVELAMVRWVANPSHWQWRQP